MASESDLVPDADPDATAAMRALTDDDLAAESTETESADAATPSDESEPNAPTDSPAAPGRGGRLSSFLRSDPVILDRTTSSGVPGLGPVQGRGVSARPSASASTKPSSPPRETAAPQSASPETRSPETASPETRSPETAPAAKSAPVVADPVDAGRDDEYIVPQRAHAVSYDAEADVAAVVVGDDTPRPTIRDRRAAGKLRARKVRRLIRHLEPWSVLKISLLFFLCLWAIFMLAGYGLWYFANEAEVLDNVENFIEQLFVLEEFAFNWDQIFRACALGGLVLVVAATGFMVLMAVLFNLISDLTGGIRITVIEEETARVWPSRRVSGDPGTASP